MDNKSDTKRMGPFKTGNNLEETWKGKQDDPSTYRGLQVGSSFCKIMVSVMIGRINEWYDKTIT